MRRYLIWWNTLSAEMFGTEDISYRCYEKRKDLHMCGNNYVQMCFEKNILCADVFREKKTYYVQMCFE